MNYSFLLALMCTPLGIITLAHMPDRSFVADVVTLAAAIIISCIGGFLNAKYKQPYRSLCWIFGINLFMLLCFIMFNKGIQDSNFLQDDTNFFLLYVAMFGFNLHWMPFANFLSLNEFELLSLSTIASVVFPSLGYWYGQYWIRSRYYSKSIRHLL